MARRITGVQSFATPNPVYAKNLLRNGDGVINQRGTVTAATPVAGANNDGAYCLDGWILLAEGNDACDVSKTTSTVPTGSRSAIALDVETADVKHGIFQIIESADCIRLLNSGYVSLSFKLQSAASISSWGAAVLAWDSTADTVTQDCVSAWNASDTAPTFATNWTLESSATAAASIGTLSTASFTEYKLEGIAIDTASTTNIGVFIYANDTTAVTAGQFSYISDIMLNEGKKCAPFEHRTVAEELRICQRYFWSSYNLGTAIATASDVGRILIPASLVNDYAANQGRATVQFPCSMRTTPTGHTYSTNDGAIDTVYENTVGNRTSTCINPGTNAMTVNVVTDPGVNTISFHASATAEL